MIQPKLFFGDLRSEVSDAMRQGSFLPAIDQVIRGMMPQNVDSLKTLTKIARLLGPEYETFRSRLESVSDISQMQLSSDVRDILREATQRTQSLHRHSYRSSAWAAEVEEYLAWLIGLLAKYPIQLYNENEQCLTMLRRIIRARKQENSSDKGEEAQLIYSGREVGLLLMLAGFIMIVGGGPIWVGVALMVAGLLKL